MIKQIDDEKLQKSLGFTPHKSQLQVLNSQARFQVWSCGRRWGKSLLAAYIAFRELFYPNRNIWIVSPTYSLSEKIWRVIHQWSMIKDMVPLIKSINRSTMRIESMTGSFVEFKSSENENSLVGEGLDLLIVDEAARVKETAITDALRPTLSDRQGRAIYISTPIGKNWFYRFYIKGQNEPGWSSFQLPSSSNPYLAKEELKSALSEYGSKDNPMYLQNYESQFIDDAGSVFRNIEACAIASIKEPEEGTKYVAGLDIARTVDWTVLTIAEAKTNAVIYFDRFQGIDWKLAEERIVTAINKYNNADLVMDSTGVGDVFYDNLINRGLRVTPFKFTNLSKEQLIRSLAVAMEEKSIIYPPKSELLNELRVFEYTQSSSGTMRYNAPDGFHDDCVISLALCLKGLAGSPSNFDGLLAFGQEKQAELLSQEKLPQLVSLVRRFGKQLEPPSY